MHAIFVRRRNTKANNHWRLSTDRTFVCLHLYHDHVLTLKEGGRERHRKRGRRGRLSEGGREGGKEWGGREGGKEWGGRERQARR